MDTRVRQDPSHSQLAQGAVGGSDDTLRKVTARAPIVVIGGGITGLAAAYELVKGGAQPVLLEARPRLGGVIQTEVVDGCLLEAGPDSFLSAKPAALELIRELGLADQVIGSNDAERVIHLVRGGRLVPLPDGLMMMVPTRILPIARTPLLTWSTKLRMGLEYFRKPPAARSRDRSVSEFIRAHYGQEAVDYLAEPLLSGVYGGSVDELSARSVLRRFVDLESEYGSLTKGVLATRRNAAQSRNGAPLFQTLKCGLGQLTQALDGYLQGRFRLIHATAETVEAAGNGYRIRAGGAWLEASSVIVACPARSAGTLLAPLDAELGSLLQGISYNSSIILAMGLERAACGPIPRGFGFLVPRRERKTMVACTFLSSKFSHRAPEGKVVLRCFLGGSGNLETLDRSDDDLTATVLTELQALLGWRPKPVFTRIHRWPQSMAQYTVGHEARINAIGERLGALPGVRLAGNAYEGIGIADCVRTGRNSARDLLRLVQA
jgi:protoporphyrinogen/coproporphyrinogen III oxidase